MDFLLTFHQCFSLHASPPWQKQFKFFPIFPGPGQLFLYRTIFY